MLNRLKPAFIIEVLIHLLFWAFITLIPYLSGPFGGSSHRFWFSPWNLVVNNAFLAVQFYLNAFFLIPVVLNKHKKILLYFVLLLIAFITIDFIIIQIQPEMPFHRFPDEHGIPTKLLFS